MGAKLPQLASLVDVHVVVRFMRSTSPDCRVGPRSLSVMYLYSTLSGSPNTAAATALHRSTSNPMFSPDASSAWNPGVSFAVAHTMLSRWIAFASLSPPAVITVSACMFAAICSDCSALSIAASRSAIAASRSAIAVFSWFIAAVAVA